MKKILYIGNKLEEHGFTPTSADSLPEKLKNEEIKSYFKIYIGKLKIVLKNGKVIDSGNHNFLIENCNEYKVLYKTQLK